MCSLFGFKGLLRSTGGCDVFFSSIAFLSVLVKFDLLGLFQNLCDLVLNNNIAKHRVLLIAGAL